MYYGNIKEYDIADGEGVRVSLFVSGCLNHCEGCFQPETWDFHYGKPYTRETENEIIRDLSREPIQGLTLLGGDPFEIENQRELIRLLRRARAELPDKDIWSYTGYIYDRDLVPGGRRYCEVTDEMLSYLDVLVDGPFILSKKNIMLYFRGSSNQRVINMPETLKNGEVVLYHE